MAESQKKWNRFQKLQVRSSGLSARAKRAESVSVKHAHRFIVSRLANAREVRRNIALWVLGIGVLIAIAAVQTVLYRSAYTTAAGAEGGTYAEGVRGSIATLNPLYVTSASEQAATKLLFSGLFTYDSTGALKGDLAKEYQVLDEGRRYRVTLKPTVFWHDNKRLTADDVVFTVNTMKDAAVGATMERNWQDVEATKVDDRTVDFTLPAVYSPFPNALTFAVLPQHILEKVQPADMRESDFGSRPIGSGPFKFRMKQSVQQTATEQNSTIVHMNRSLNYYGGTPKVERFQIHSYSSDEALGKALRSHAVSAVSGISFDRYKQFSDDTGYSTDTRLLHSGVYALFNTNSSSSPLKNEEVRRALQLGTDVAKANAALPVKVTQLDAPILASQVSLSQIKKPAYDVKKAEKILDEAGWIKGKNGVRTKDNASLTIRVVTVKDADYAAEVANLSKQWRALGFDVQSEEVDTSDPSRSLASSVLQPRDFDVLVHELNIGADPDVYAFWHSSQAVSSGLNFSNYHSDVADAALSSARLRIESDLRAAKYESFVKQWYKDAPAIGLYQKPHTYVRTKSSSAYEQSGGFVTANNRFDDVVRWTVREMPVYKTP